MGLKRTRRYQAMSNQANATPSTDALGRETYLDVPMIGTYIRRNLIRPITASKREWNGDRSDWESWPIGRPGPFVSESVTRDLLRYFVAYEGTRFLLRGEPAFHVAEFSANGQGEAIYSRNHLVTSYSRPFPELFSNHVTESQLAGRLNLEVCIYVGVKMRKY